MDEIEYMVETLIEKHHKGEFSFFILIPKFHLLFF